MIPDPSSDSPDEFEAAIDGFPVAAQPAREDELLTIEALAEQFTAEVRNGGTPSIEEYAARHPDMAEDIREVFPALIVLEQWKLDKEVECLRRNVPRQFPVDRLGTCQVVREIGRGGMGVVFEAFQEPTGEHVAVKLLPWRYGASVSRWRQRFESEARTISQLEHPHIISILGFGEQDGYWFYVMPLVNGVSLDWVIKRFREQDELALAEELHLAREAGDPKSTPLPPGPMPAVDSYRLRRNSWQEFARIVYQSARAVAHAHSHGVLHNDIKPGNVLLDTDGRVRVGDFGLARDLDGETATDGDRLSGTLRYMAPERFAGYCDSLSDVYSLGATLYELATQSPLFATSDRGPLIDAITKADYELPTHIDPQFPRPLEAIILQAMDSEPGRRYPSAAALADDLLKFANGRPIRARGRGPVRRFLQWLSGKR